MSEESWKSNQDKEKEQAPAAKDRKAAEKKEEPSEPETSAHGDFTHEDEFAFGSNISGISVEEEAKAETKEEAPEEPEEPALGGRGLEIDETELPESAPEPEEVAAEEPVESFMGGRGLDIEEFKTSKGDNNEPGKAKREELMGGRGLEVKIEQDGSLDGNLLISKILGQEEAPAKEPARPGDLQEDKASQQESRESEFDLAALKKKAAAAASLKKAAKKSISPIAPRIAKAKKKSGFGLIFLIIVAVLVAIGAFVYLTGPEELLDRIKTISVTEEAPTEPAAPATLDVTSEPPGAEVLWDGMKLGSTPAKLTNIQPGTHGLTLIFQDGKQITRQVELSPGEKRQINIGHPAE